jgi:hypothetical protein
VASGGGTVYTDNFNRADTTQVSGGLGAAWTSDGWMISSNQAFRNNASGGGDFATFTQDLGSADHWVEVVRNGGIYAVCNARHPTATDGQNCYMGFWSPGANAWVIGKVVGGSYSDVNVGTSAGTPTAGTLQRLECQGSVQRLYANNTLVATGGDTSLTAGNFIGMNADSATFDNMRCGQLPWS